MNRTQGRRTRTVAIVVLVIVLLVVGVVAFAVNTQRSNTVDSSKTPNDISVKEVTKEDTKTETDDDVPVETTNPTVDPETLASVAIEPLGITVYYSKGTPGFEFSVMKTTDKTEYVQFTSADLVGTKCTNDEGAFASIIKNPSANEAQTTSQTVKVGEDSYGLSLASTGCTGNAELLAKYQSGFKNGFANLTAL